MRNNKRVQRATATTLTAFGAVLPPVLLASSFYSYLCWPLCLYSFVSYCPQLSSLGPRQGSPSVRNGLLAMCTSMSVIEASPTTMAGSIWYSTYNTDHTPATCVLLQQSHTLLANHQRCVIHVTHVVLLVVGLVFCARGHSVPSGKITIKRARFLPFQSQ